MNVFLSVDRSAPMTASAGRSGEVIGDEEEAAADDEEAVTIDCENYCN